MSRSPWNILGWMAVIVSAPIVAAITLFTVVTVIIAMLSMLSTCLGG